MLRSKLVGSATDGVVRKAALGFLQLAALHGVFVFVPAGTLRFVEGWVFLAVFFGSSLAITVYLARHYMELLRRRTQAGPAAEPRVRQKVIQGVASFAFVATLAVPAPDRRFGWSHAPVALVVAGRRPRPARFPHCFLRVPGEQLHVVGDRGRRPAALIETGPYAIVRHPMYVGGLVLVAGTPLVLGSLVGLVTLAPFGAVIAWRVLDEERFLEDHLAGYAAYRAKTPYRLIPHVW